MGTQTQGRGGQQGGIDKKSQQEQKPAHDPELRPERDQRNADQRRTSKQDQGDNAGSRRGAATGDTDVDDLEPDSIEEPGEPGAIDELKAGSRRDGSH
jgi:hypothetical protein